MALKQVKQFKVQTKEKGIGGEQIKGLLDLVKNKTKAYKTTFLVSHRDQFIPMNYPEAEPSGYQNNLS